MTRDEVIALLAVANTYDDRKPSQALISAWSESAERAGWTLDAAKNAIHAHYAENTDRIMPGHITQHIKAENRRWYEQ
ncbi:MULTISPECIES: hypothetical protein [Nocardia]|uniref:hypothetical protein n=1 Tax=Nocardia TaxID=1817 RepID=UPI001300BD12|nr:MULTISPECIES: hypothetical protein [Nocardia]